MLLGWMSIYIYGSMEGGSASVLEIAELLRAADTCYILGDFPILGMLLLFVEADLHSISVNRAAVTVYKQSEFMLKSNSCAVCLILTETIYVLVLDPTV